MDMRKALMEDLANTGGRRSINSKGLTIYEDYNKTIAKVLALSKKQNQIMLHWHDMGFDLYILLEKLDKTTWVAYEWDTENRKIYNPAYGPSPLSNLLLEIIVPLVSPATDDEDEDFIVVLNLIKNKKPVVLDGDEYDLPHPDGSYTLIGDMEVIDFEPININRLKNGYHPFEDDEWI